MPPRGGVEESPENVVADGEQEPEGVPFGEYAARCPVDCHFHGTKLARGWSVRVGKMEGASLEDDMVFYGERGRAWHV